MASYGEPNFGNQLIPPPVDLEHIDTTNLSEGARINNVPYPGGFDRLSSFIADTLVDRALAALNPERSGVYSTAALTRRVEDRLHSPGTADELGERYAVIVPTRAPKSSWYIGGRLAVSFAAVRSLGEGEQASGVVAVSTIFVEHQRRGRIRSFQDLDSRHSVFTDQNTLRQLLQRKPRSPKDSTRDPYKPLVRKLMP